MKRKTLLFFALALVLSLCLAFVACVDKNGGINKLTAESGVTLDGAFENDSVLKAEHHAADSEQGKAATTTAYGFNKDVLAEDPARILKASDFAKFHGVSMGNTQKDYVTWYTRSPSLAVGNQGYTTFVLYRDNKGVINSPNLVAEGGVVPALWITL